MTKKTPYISTLDMLKIGVGPSSSHTMGPWLAMRQFVAKLRQADLLQEVCELQIQIYGSLAKTGLGHGTDIAILLGLEDRDYRNINCSKIPEYHKKIANDGKLLLGGDYFVNFDLLRNLQFMLHETLPQHPNGIRCSARCDTSGPLPGTLIHEEYFSIGGGFVLCGSELDQPVHGELDREVPYPFDTGAQLTAHCERLQCSIAEVVQKNEQALHADKYLDGELAAIWNVMLESIYRGVHSEGELPVSGLPRRAPGLFRNIQMNQQGNLNGSEPLGGWLQQLRKHGSTIVPLDRALEFISCCAIAVNEHNACFGRVVTAPTNGSAGIIPAVLLYYYVVTTSPVSEQQIREFLFTAAAIGGLFKAKATISAAMGGCQAEIGVSSAMAAAAYCSSLGGSVVQACAAAEIAMEHHLGLTCDPVGGLVQIPCIERNAIGAVKSITAAHLALKSESFRVSLDDIIHAMWETAQGMSLRYKETAEGGLALRVPVRRSPWHVRAQDEMEKKEICATPANSMAHSTC